MTDKNKNSKANIGTGTKFLIGEDRLENRLTLIIHDDNSFEWTRNTSKSSLFETLDEAENIVDKLFKNEDFGIEIYKVRVITDSKQNKYLRFVESNESLREKYRLKLSDITQSDVDLTINNLVLNNMFNIPKQTIIENRNEIKSIIISKIGKLIDLHNTCDITYAPIYVTLKEREEKNCKDCIICNKIEELASYLDYPYLSKFYSHLSGDEKDRFNKININNYQGEIDDKHLIKLNYAMRDFLELRKYDFNLSEISEIYGITRGRMNIFYDILSKSKYHKTVGKSERVNADSKVRNRTDIDIPIL